MGYGRLMVQTSGGQSDTFQTKGRQREFRPNNGWVYCNYLFFLVESVLKYTCTLKTPCLQKFKFFIWKCTHNRLPTHSFIAQHQHGIGFECFRCLNLESTLHVIQDYP